MKSLVLILGDQLSESISSLQDFNKNTDLILLCELHKEASYVKHHKKKIVFIFSAMRHFAKALSAKGYNVKYVKLNDADNTGSFHQEIQKLVNKLNFKRLIITEPGEYRLMKEFQDWKNSLDIYLDIRTDTRFLCSKLDFAEWAGNKKNLRMENFYREMRKKYNILMDGENPECGKWNFDSSNRKAANSNLKIPKPHFTKVDEITQEVISLVSERFNDHFGDIEPFYFAVTRKDALLVLARFIEERLIYYGDFQDAMLEGEPWLFHAHISFYLNCGLLLPMECIKAVEKIYYQGKAPINAVEGFIRQVIGWREYVRGIYWLKMPEYAEKNFFQANRKLPDFFWTAKTKMNCIAQSALETKQHAYAHHIQRLMVLGNFALIAGIDPKEVNEWFLIVYADAYEWVELPNVSGMILFADGGYLASKPYASGGSYINKMSNYCRNCHYKVNIKNGNNACPFNYLYWDFLARNKEKLKNNFRIGMMYKTYAKMSQEKKDNIRTDSEQFFNNI